MAKVKLAKKATVKVVDPTMKAVLAWIRNKEKGGGMSEKEAKDLWKAIYG
tara:strand:+ start:562 stop:711 length:150 start_codon:yes stop_codon:yes gene_type:complete